MTLSPGLQVTDYRRLSATPCCVVRNSPLPLKKKREKERTGSCPFRSVHEPPAVDDTNRTACPPSICVRMADSPAEGNSPLAHASPTAVHHAGSRPSSSSGSSYIGSDAPTTDSVNCPWRTPEFHEDECSRYFDCPTHVVERQLPEPAAAVLLVEPSAEPSHANSIGGPSAVVDPEETPGPSSRRSESPPEERSRSVSTSSSEQLGEASPQNDNDRPPMVPPRDESYFPNMSHEPEAARAGLLELPIRTTSLPQTASTLSQTTDPTQRRLPSPPLPPVPQSTRPSMLELPPTPRSTSETTSSSAASSSRSLHRNPSELVLPRWQPDSDVTFCPICRTQFSFFVRKHHCRFVSTVTPNLGFLSPPPFLFFFFSLLSRLSASILTFSSLNTGNAGVWCATLVLPTELSYPTNT